MQHKQRIGTLVICLVITLMIFAYSMILFRCYQTKTFIFTPYTPKKRDDIFFPQGDLRKLTQREIEDRITVIRSSV